VIDNPYEVKASRREHRTLERRFYGNMFFVDVALTILFYRSQMWWICGACGLHALLSLIIWVSECFRSDET